MSGPCFSANGPSLSRLDHSLPLWDWRPSHFSDSTSLQGLQLSAATLHHHALSCQPPGPRAQISACPWVLSLLIPGHSSQPTPGSAHLLQCPAPHWVGIPHMKVTFAPGPAPGRHSQAPLLTQSPGCTLGLDAGTQNNLQASWRAPWNPVPPAIPAL